MLHCSFAAFGSLYAPDVIISYYNYYAMTIIIIAVPKLVKLLESPSHGLTRDTFS